MSQLHAGQKTLYSPFLDNGLVFSCTGFVNKDLDGVYDIWIVKWRTMFTL